MLGIGWTEFIVIALGILIFVGPRNLPGLLKKAGSLMSEIKSVGRELNDQIAGEVRDLEKEIGPIRSPSKSVKTAARDWVNKLPPSELRIRDVKRKADEQLIDFHGDLESSSEDRSYSEENSKNVALKEPNEKENTDVEDHESGTRKVTTV